MAGQVLPDIAEDLGALVEQGHRFGTVYADPPWPYRKKVGRGAAARHYDSMSLKDIAALPVAALASDESHLHLWTTNAFVFDSFNIIEAWGFEFKDCMVWVKPEMGLGNYLRVAHELLLLGVRGDAPFIDNEPHRSWLMAKRLRHSEKPAGFRSLIETVSPGPRLELFAREANPGWTAWGNEVSPTLFAGRNQERETQT